MTLRPTIVLKLEVETKVWIMYSFMVEHMSQVVTEKETFNNLFLNNLEFFQCKIWDNLCLIKKFLMDKTKVVGPADLMVKDQKWLISFINEITI